MFGEGKIRARISCDDGTSGIATVPYIGDINTLDETDLKSRIRKMVLVEYGKHVTDIQIIGWY